MSTIPLNENPTYQAISHHLHDLVHRLNLSIYWEDLDHVVIHQEGPLPPFVNIADLKTFMTGFDAIDVIVTVDRIYYYHFWIETAFFMIAAHETTISLKRLQLGIRNIKRYLNATLGRYLRELEAADQPQPWNCIAHEGTPTPCTPTECPYLPGCPYQQEEPDIEDGYPTKTIEEEVYDWQQGQRTVTEDDQ
jgi:hypothetical protein